MWSRGHEVGRQEGRPESGGHSAGRRAAGRAARRWCPGDVVLKRQREQQQRQRVTSPRRCRRRRRRLSVGPANPGLSGGPARPRHSASDRGLPVLALPREPASRPGMRPGGGRAGAQHKDLFPGAAAAAAAASLEPPAEAEPAPGPSSPQVPGAAAARLPRPRAPSAEPSLVPPAAVGSGSCAAPLLPALRGSRGACRRRAIWRKPSR